MGEDRAALGVNAARQLSADDQPLAVDVLVGAFATDPWFRWLYPGDDYQDRAGEWFSLVLSRVWDRAEAWATEGGEAAAVWIRPGHEVAGADDLVAIAQLVDRQLGDRAEEVVAALGVDLQEPEQPMWRCLYVGVRPGYQGRGLGAWVMAPPLASADEAGLRSTVTSTNPRNVPFYERLGFKSLDRAEAAPGRWFESLVREPRR